MKKCFTLFYYCFFVLPLVSWAKTKSVSRQADTIIVKIAIDRDHISDEWKAALKSRMTKEYIDSLVEVNKTLSVHEQKWKKLITAKGRRWNSYRDSLAVPFINILLPDTIYILLGCGGADDGFTYGSQTVCFDLTALQKNYGDATLPENNERMDRLFAHEYTHLLHKAWAAKKNLILPTFKDSILWECIYEGIGMYRSLNPKWLPIKDSLPTITISTLKDLSPVFAHRMIVIHTLPSLTKEEKEKLIANLSRGPVSKKWGALPVAIWLALEAKGDHRNLIKWIEKGPGSVLELAAKYLDNKYWSELDIAINNSCD